MPIARMPANCCRRDRIAVVEGHILRSERERATDEPVDPRPASNHACVHSHLAKRQASGESKIAPEDDRRLGPDQFVVSLRHYRPAEGELSRERLKAALSTAEGLLLQPRGEGELIELSDDEAVAAAVMLPMVAADRLAPSASSHTGGAFKRNARGSSEAIFLEGPCPGTRAALALQGQGRNVLSHCFS